MENLFIGSGTYPINSKYGIHNRISQIWPHLQYVYILEFPVYDVNNEVQLSAMIGILTEMGAWCAGNKEQLRLCGPLRTVKKFIFPKINGTL